MAFLLPKKSAQIKYSIKLRRDRARHCPQKNHILNQIHGQPQGLSLRLYMFLNSMNPVGATCGRLQIHSKLKTGEHSSPLRYKTKIQLFVTVDLLSFNGGSKPPPYHVVVCSVSFATAFGCLSLTMQLLLFRKNHARLACSVVNALTTAHCRYQLLRFADRGKPCPYGRINFQI